MNFHTHNAERLKGSESQTREKFSRYILILKNLLCVAAKQTVCALSAQCKRTKFYQFLPKVKLADYGINAKICAL